VSHRTLYYGLPFVIILLLFSFWRGSLLQSAQSWSSASKPFPAINLPIISDSAKRFTNQDLLGKISMVNFWASWCAACQQEHNVLLWIKKNYPVAIYGINYKDDPNKATAMLLRFGNPYDIAVKDEMGSSALALGIDALPQTYLIDKRGRIRYHHVGAIDRLFFENIILPFIQKIEKE
jgi:cytochrome c biogenesis protein CcmG/thiol:disulfide interchange protein DsbE